MTNEAKLNTIRKLIAKAQGTTNPNEAAIFMAKAQEMMAAEGVDMEAVDLAGIGEAEVKSQFSVSRMKPYELTLMHGIADAFGCTVLWMKNRSWVRMLGEDNYASFIFVGSKDRLSLATYAAAVLGRQLRKARAEFSDKRSKHYWDYALEGYTDPDDISDIKESCKAAIRRQVTKDADSFAAGWAWEVRKKAVKFALNDKEQALLQTYAHKATDGAKADEPKEQKLNNSFYDGQAAAKGAHLHRPIDGSAEEANLLGETRQLTHGG